MLATSSSRSEAGSGDADEEDAGSQRRGKEQCEEIRLTTRLTSKLKELAGDDDIVVVADGDDGGYDKGS